MPRPEKPRSIGNHTHEDMLEALRHIQSGMTIRKASTTYKFPFTTLRRYYLKAKNVENLESLRLVPNYEVNKIFNKEQEKELKDYYIYCSLIFYGLTEKGSRRVAYQMAKTNNIKMPQNWIENEMAGKEWLRSFRRRHLDVSLRKPEPCSLARATAFNKANVETFYNNLEKLYERNPKFADGTRIYNLDETSTMTVQKPQRVIALKGRRNVSKITSGERGTLVTTCCIVSASGTALPPVMVFPRKNFKNYMTKNTPAGTLGLAAPSGWMNSEIFPEVIQHFIKHTNSTPENPSILIMDNHESHLSIEALNLAKAAGVNILTLPPHTSAKLQPLDVGIFGPFKTYYNAAIDSWLLRNPGRPVSIYEVGELVGVAFLKAMTPTNITNAFRKCGIFPFDRNVFVEEDFMPSLVTDRPCPVQEQISDLPSTSRQTDLGRTRIQSIDSDITVCEDDVVQSLEPLRDNSPSIFEDSGSHIYNSPSKRIPSSTATDTCDITSPTLTQQVSSNPKNCDNSFKSQVLTESTTHNIGTPTHPINKKTFLSPFEFMSPIKAPPRKNNRKSRKPGRSLIATDTPEKTEIEMAKASSLKRNNPKRRKVTKRVLQSDSDEEELPTNVVYQESDDDMDWFDDDMENEVTNSVLTEEIIDEPLPRVPVEGEYVLVLFTTKKKRVYYVGKVLEERNANLEYYISFLRKKSNNKYHFPDVPDLASVKEHDIKFILPKPTITGSTTRQQSYHSFSVDLSNLNMR